MYFRKPSPRHHSRRYYRSGERYYFRAALNACFHSRRLLILASKRTRRAGKGDGGGDLEVGGSNWIKISSTGAPLQGPFYGGTSGAGFSP